MFRTYTDLVALYDTKRNQTRMETWGFNSYLRKGWKNV